MSRNMPINTAKLNGKAPFKMRPCMNEKCKKMFLSAHAGNRFCATCTRLAEHTYMAEPHKVYI